MKTAVVVGAGAGGGVVAKELATNGFHVVLLERGKWYTAADNRKDDLRNQRNSPLGNAFGPENEPPNPRVLVDDHGRERIVQPNEDDYQDTAACVGGGTLSYGALAWRYMEPDFRMRTTYGAVAGSTLDDWPISYDDLEPYYEKAEWEIGVSGDVSNNIFQAPRRKDLPMPPLPPNREYRILKPAAERLNLHPFDVPMLRNSVPYNGRGACMRCRWCVGFACEVDAKCGTQNTVIPKALASGNCELKTDSIVSRILTGARGRATGVEYFEDGRNRRQVNADLVVVSGSAIESARLLLNSKSALYPNGIGNRYDWVGRNLQGHTYAGAVGLFENDVYDDVGPGCSIAACDYNHGNPGLVGGGMLANEFIRLPVQFVGYQPPGMPKWGQAHKDFMRSWYRRQIGVQGPMQELPLYDSRVQADGKVKDYWGIPVARLSGNIHPHTIEVAKFVAGKAEAWLQEAGAIRTWWKRISVEGPSAGQHQAGTCRMGNDPKTSVVDKYCRVHDMDNVYVVDGSVHPNNGGFNPVLTIMANAYRVSDYMVKYWGSGA